jgi:phosphate starvation-inducible protein PhoH and related proteins
MAVSALTTNQVKSIILTRPAVEAGEKLGFLPGDVAQKVNPYLRPLHDALNDMLGPDKTAAMIEQGIIEIAPLAFMRGRTLSNAFIILDEAQNTTREQMKMFLTRIGFDSQAVVTGDSTQVDLPVKNHSGLLQAKKILNNIEGIRFCTFSKEDVVRHPLVQKIINAYEKQ